MERRDFLARLGKAAIIAPVTLPTIMAANQEEIAEYSQIPDELPPLEPDLPFGAGDVAIACRHEGRTYFMRGRWTALDLDFGYPVPPSLRQEWPADLRPNRVDINLQATCRPGDVWTELHGTNKPTKTRR